MLAPCLTRQVGAARCYEPLLAANGFEGMGQALPPSAVFAEPEAPLRALQQACGLRRRPGGRLLAAATGHGATVFSHTQCVRAGR